jgi:hypothetical protein
MTHAHHAPPSKADLAYETFYSAALGGLAVALLFLVVDLVAGHPLFTPSLIGSVLFFGADAAAVEGVNFTAMALFTVVHLVGFGILGFVSTLLVRTVEEKTGGGFVAPALVLFALLEGGFLAFADVLLPGVAAVVGHELILLGNALAAITMTLFLRYAHETSEGEMQREQNHSQAGVAPA